ncbi:uncharacterized protein MONOS_14020 [Monocercomonoides exilis]|uniref:uncharacterized protein n=1 Tax=Monocercomonoides exilis TaxID=2049356 RepID=UPI00355983FC|nr:hypothetical protein MONOS_14020 [Monocercomonoides exilis]
MIHSIFRKLTKQMNSEALITLMSDLEKMNDRNEIAVQFERITEKVGGEHFDFTEEEVACAANVMRKIYVKWSNEKEIIVLCSELLRCLSAKKSNGLGNKVFLRVVRAILKARAEESSVNISRTIVALYDSLSPDVEVSGFIDLEMQLLRFSRQKNVISNGFDFLLKLAQSNESVMSISFAREALVLMHSLVPLCCGSEAGVAMGRIAEAIAARQEKAYREMLFEEQVLMLILQAQGEMQQRHMDQKQKREGKEEGKEEGNNEADKCEEWEIWKRVFNLVYGNLVEEMELAVEDMETGEKGGGREERRMMEEKEEKEEKEEEVEDGDGKEADMGVLMFGEEKQGKGEVASLSAHHLQPLLRGLLLEDEGFRMFCCEMLNKLLKPKEEEEEQMKERLKKTNELGRKYEGREGNEEIDQKRNGSLSNCEKGREREKGKGKVKSRQKSSKGNKKVKGKAKKGEERQKGEGDEALKIGFMVYEEKREIGEKEEKEEKQSRRREMRRRWVLFVANGGFSQISCALKRELLNRKQKAFEAAVQGMHAYELNACYSASFSHSSPSPSSSSSSSSSSSTSSSSSSFLVQPFNLAEFYALCISCSICHLKSYFDVLNAVLLFMWIADTKNGVNVEVLEKLFVALNEIFRKNNFQSSVLLSALTSEEALSSFQSVFLYSHPLGLNMLLHLLSGSLKSVRQNLISERLKTNSFRSSLSSFSSYASSSSSSSSSNSCNVPTLLLLHTPEPSSLKLPNFLRPLIKQSLADLLYYSVCCNRTSSRAAVSDALSVLSVIFAVSPQIAKSFACGSVMEMLKKMRRSEESGWKSEAPNEEEEGEGEGMKGDKGREDEEGKTESVFERKVCFKEEFESVASKAAELCVVYMHNVENKEQLMNLKVEEEFEEEEEIAIESMKRGDVECCYASLCVLSKLLVLNGDKPSAKKEVERNSEKLAKAFFKCVAEIKEETLFFERLPFLDVLAVGLLSVLSERAQLLNRSTRKHVREFVLRAISVPESVQNKMDMHFERLAKEAVLDQPEKSKNEIAIRDRFDTVISAKGLFDDDYGFEEREELPERGDMRDGTNTQNEIQTVSDGGDACGNEVLIRSLSSSLSSSLSLSSSSSFEIHSHHSILSLDGCSCAVDVLSCLCSSTTKSISLNLNSNDYLKLKSHLQAFVQICLACPSSATRCISNVTAALEELRSVKYDVYIQTVEQLVQSSQEQFDFYTKSKMSVEIYRWLKDEVTKTERVELTLHLLCNLIPSFPSGFNAIYYCAVREDIFKYISYPFEIPFEREMPQYSEKAKELAESLFIRPSLATKQFSLLKNHSTLYREYSCTLNIAKMRNGMLAVCFAMYDLKVSERTLSELMPHLCLNVLAGDSNRKNKNDRENKHFKENEESICAMFLGMAYMFKKGYRFAVGKLFADKRAYKMIETCCKQTLHPYTLSNIGLFLREIARHWSGKLNSDFIQLLEIWGRDVQKSMKAIKPHFREVLGIVCLDIAVNGSFHSIPLEVSKKLMELGSKMLAAPTIFVAEAMHKWSPSHVQLSSSAATLHMNCMISFGISYYRLAVYNSLVNVIKYAEKYQLLRYFLEVMEEQGMEDVIYAKCCLDGWIESFKYLVNAFMRFKKAEG